MPSFLRVCGGYKFHAAIAPGGERIYTTQFFFFLFIYIFECHKKNGSAGGAIAQRAIFERKNIYFIFFFLKSDPFVIFFLEPSR